MARIISPNGFTGPIGNGAALNAQAGYFSRIGVGQQVPTNDVHITQSQSSTPALRIDGAGANVSLYVKSTQAGAQTLLQFENTSTGSTNPVKVYLPGNSTTLTVSIQGTDVFKFAQATLTFAPSSGQAANFNITGTAAQAQLNFTSGTGTTARIYQALNTTDLRIYVNGSDRLIYTATDLTTQGAVNLVVGTAAIATTATAGFIYAPSCAGVPTGVPATRTGTVPIVVDSTDSKLYAYIGGAWKSVTLA